MNTDQFGSSGSIMRNEDRSEVLVVPKTKTEIPPASKGIYALCGNIDRSNHLKKRVKKQYWDRKKIKSHTRCWSFFRHKDEINSLRNRNTLKTGQIPIRKAVEFEKIILKFDGSGNPEDIQDLLDSSLLRLIIEGENNINWIHLDKIDNYNYSVNLKSEKIRLHAGQCFFVDLDVKDEISLTKPLKATVIVEVFYDEPIT